MFLDMKIFLSLLTTQLIPQYARVEIRFDAGQKHIIACETSTLLSNSHFLQTYCIFQLYIY